MSACCSPATPRRLTPWDCLERGLKTRRQPPLPMQGEAVAAADGRHARFSVQLAGGRVQALRFDCTHCTTLIVCCQALVELNRDCPVRAPQVHEAVQLLARLPGLPASRRGCAVLASTALRSALAVARVSTVSLEESA